MLQHGLVEDLTDASQMLPHLICLLGHPGEKLEIGLLVGVKVKRKHVPGLVVAVHAAIPLFEPHGVPGYFLVDDVPGGGLEETKWFEVRLSPF